MQIVAWGAAVDKLRMDGGVHFLRERISDAILAVSVKEISGTRLREKLRKSSRRGRYYVPSCAVVNFLEEERKR